MRPDKFTTKFQMALSDAQSLAVGRDHQYVEPLHVLLALLDQQGGSVRHLLAQAGAIVNALRAKLGEALERLPTVAGHGGDVQVSNDCNSEPSPQFRSVTCHARLTEQDIELQLGDAALSSLRKLASIRCTAQGR